MFFPCDLQLESCYFSNGFIIFNLNDSTRVIIRRLKVIKKSLKIHIKKIEKNVHWYVSFFVSFKN